mgnify:FL=1
MKSFRLFLKESQLKESVTISDFVNFASNHLGITNPPRVRLMTTASYNLNDGEISIVSNGRRFMDVCRSIAHELVHQKQHQKLGDPSLLDGNTGSPHEDEANMEAGRIIRKYGEMYPDFYHISPKESSTLYNSYIDAKRKTPSV